MCDEITERENKEYLSRRELSIGGATALLVSCAGGSATAPASNVSAATPVAAKPVTKRRSVTVDTPDGQADGVFLTPESGEHPGVLLWPDVAGLRPAYETMAERLASAGFAVLVVNPYYRSEKGHVLGDFEKWRTDEGRARIAPMREALTPEAITRDGVAFVAWLDQQDEVDTSRKIGTQGYCMSGSFTFRVAAAVPERVGVIASFHGGGLVTDEADSPHALFAKMKAAALICIAQNDHERTPQASPVLKKAATEANITSEIEIYPANHGWCALDSPVFDKTQADRAWQRLLATYQAHL